MCTQPIKVSDLVAFFSLRDIELGPEALNELEALLTNAFDKKTNINR